MMVAATILSFGEIVPATVRQIPAFLRVISATEVQANSGTAPWAGPVVAALGLVLAVGGERPPCAAGGATIRSGAPPSRLRAGCSPIPTGLEEGFEAYVRWR